MAKLVYKKDRQREENLDEFVQAGESIVQDVTSNNNRSIVYGIIAVVFVLIVVAVSGEFVEKANVKRSTAIESVFTSYQKAVLKAGSKNVDGFKTSEERKAAIVGALETSKKDLAEKAYLLSGVEADLALADGNSEKAAEILSGMKAKFETSLISEQIELSRVNLLESKIGAEKALQEMVKLSANVTDKYIREATVYHIGRLALLAGKDQQAIDNFADLKKNYSSSAFLPLAIARLDAKGLKIPEEKKPEKVADTSEKKAESAGKATPKSN